MQVYYVYILTNIHHTVFYTGMTNDLENRVFLHKVKYNRGFTSKYNCTKLVYHEEYPNALDAIYREKQLKKYLRKWKIDLITKMNPGWNDLSEGWYDSRQFESFRVSSRG